jgi:hypothetical protein
MKPWQLVVPGLILLAAAGCRTNPNIALLERDNYRKDREINRLRWCNEDLQEALNSADQRSADRDRTRDEPRARTRRNHEEPSELGPPQMERGTPSKGVPDSLKGRGSLPADIPEVPDNIRNATPNKSSDDGPSLERGSDRAASRRGDISLAGESAAVPFNPSGDSRRVRSIVLDPAITGGIGSGDATGDQGLLVAVTPLDAAGRIVDAPAEVNVTAFDRALKGEAARVARWDFTPAETASLFRRTGNSAAIHLAMGWPANSPKHRKLQLFVRYVTSDGRKLETNGPIEIALPGDRTARATQIEQSARNEGPPDRDPAEPRRLDAPPEERGPRTTPYMATRTPDTKPERPAWSPERR